MVTVVPVSPRRQTYPSCCQSQTYSSLCRQRGQGWGDRETCDANALRKKRQLLLVQETI